MSSALKQDTVVWRGRKWLGPFTPAPPPRELRVSDLAESARRRIETLERFADAIRVRWEKDGLPTDSPEYYLMRELEGLDA